MTVETYAAISAAMAGGDQPEVVLARLGLRADDWAAAMQQMSERFAAEPHLRLAYQEPRTDLGLGWPALPRPTHRRWARLIA